MKSQHHYYQKRKNVGKFVKPGKYYCYRKTKEYIEEINIFDTSFHFPGYNSNVNYYLLFIFLIIAVVRYTNLFTIFFNKLEIKPCGLGSRIQDVEADLIY